MGVESYAAGIFCVDVSKKYSKQTKKRKNQAKYQKNQFEDEMQWTCLQAHILVKIIFTSHFPCFHFKR